LEGTTLDDLLRELLGLLRRRVERLQVLLWMSKVTGHEVRELEGQGRGRGKRRKDR